MLKLNADIVPIDWIAPQPFEKIESYARRISAVIDSNETFILLGVSFGGLIAVEISKILNPALTIIISSASTRYELRTTFRWLGKTGIVQLLPSRFFMPPMKIACYLFGAENKKLLREILKDTDPDFAKWALNTLLT